MIQIAEFEIDPRVVAKSVYSNAPHMTSTTGVIIGKEVAEELSGFLQHYLKFLEGPERLFFRIDAFVSEQTLTVVEINVELQDGWGVALNLLRACKRVPVLCSKAVLPSRFIDYGDGHRKEFELACSELGLLGYPCTVQDHVAGRAGHSHWEPLPIHPKKSEFDSKMYLAQFSRIWSGGLVRIPPMYAAYTTAWENVPANVVFKFNHKYGQEALRARYSVIPRAKTGKAKFLRQCYNKHTLVAQQQISPLALADGRVTQAVIMCAGIYPVTGYLQIAPAGSFIINDRTAIAGPLVFE